MAKERTKIIEKFIKKYEKEKNKGKWSKDVNDAYNKVKIVNGILDGYANSTKEDRETVKKFRKVVIPTRLALEKCWKLADEYNKSLEEYEKVREATIKRLDDSPKKAMEDIDALGVALTPREQRALFYILDDAPLEKLILPDKRKFPNADQLGKQFPAYSDDILSKSQLVVRLINQFEAAIKEWKKKK